MDLTLGFKFDSSLKCVHSENW